VAPVSPKPFLWTCDLLNRVADCGAFEGRHVFLVNGELLEMAPPGPAHSTAVSLADYLFKTVFAKGHIVRVQDGLPLGLAVDPLPDLSVIPGSVRDFSVKHPRTAVLVVEVADSSLSYDLGDKAHLYAAAGIADYWVVDLVSRRVVVHRDPRPDPAVPFGAGYAKVIEFPETAAVAPLAASGTPVRVAELLP
jgi:Uma2 family endonuclease